MLSLTLFLSLFLALSHTFQDFLLILISSTFSCDAWVFTQNQDQDTKIPNSLISDLFWFSSGPFSKTCNRITKGKRTLRVQMQINTCTRKSLLSKQTESILYEFNSVYNATQIEQINPSSKLSPNNSNFIT